MSNTITIELSADDRRLLELILHTLGEINLRLAGQTEPVAAQTEAVEKTTTPEVEAPQEAKKAPAVTHEDIRSACMRLTAAGKKASAQEIIKAQDAKRISDIPEDRLADVLQQLTALEG